MADERNLIPRPSAWADRTGPSGWKDTSPIFGPQKAVPPAQSNALGFRPHHDSTLKGSFGLSENIMPQSLAKVYIHAIFSTKNREPVLADEWREELFAVLGGTANNLGCQSLIVGGVADHAHMLFQLGRTIAIADAIGKIKSTSSA